MHETVDRTQYNRIFEKFGCQYIIKIYHYKSGHEEGDWVKLPENSVGFCEYVNKN